MEKFNQVNIVLLLTEVLLEEVVDGSFKHERIVDSDVSDAFLRSEAEIWLEGQEKSRNEGEAAHDSVPTRLSSTSHTLIHHIISDEEVGLKLYERERLQISFRTTIEYESEKLTSSIHHPRMAAFRYSSSVNLDPLMISTVSTTEIPRFNFPANSATRQLPPLITDSRDRLHTSRSVVVEVL